MPRTLALIAVAAALAGAPSNMASAQGTGPAFDCSKATGSIETLICGDPALAALDRKLDGVYRAAFAKAQDDMPRVLRAEQRGWVKRGHGHLAWRNARAPGALSTEGPSAVRPGVTPAA
jgi:uncharacterized protein